MGSSESRDSSESRTRRPSPPRPAAAPRGVERYRRVASAPGDRLVEYERVGAEMDARQLAEWALTTLATLAPPPGQSYVVVLTFVMPDAGASACTHRTLDRRLRASSRCPECRRAVTLVGVPIEPIEPRADDDSARVDALAARLASTDFRVGAYVLDASRVLLGPLKTSRYVAGGENYFWSFLTPGA